jgi:hypothetical protein
MILNKINSYNFKISKFLINFQLIKKPLLSIIAKMNFPKNYPNITQKLFRISPKFPRNLPEIYHEAKGGIEQSMASGFPPDLKPN